MRKVRLGLIGLGQMGKIHLKNCLSLESARLVAVSDVSKKALKHAKNMGARNTFKDYQQLLENKSVEAVLIALPTHLHSSCAQKAAEAGKDIFLEKPLARNVSEGKEIVSAVRKNGVKLMVGYPIRFDSSFHSLKEEMQSGALGEIQIAYATNIGPGPFYHRAEDFMPRPVPAWWFDKELTGGGALMDLGCHMINLLRWYFGEVSDIKSYLGHRFNMDFEDHATCMAKFGTGAVAVISVGWVSMKNYLRVELVGTVNHAFVPHTTKNRMAAAIKNLAARSSTLNYSYFRELEYFTNCVRRDVQPSPSGNDALKDLETISLAYKNKIQFKNH